MTLAKSSMLYVNFDLLPIAAHLNVNISFDRVKEGTLLVSSITLAVPTARSSDGDSQISKSIKSESSQRGTFDRGRN